MFYIPRYQKCMIYPMYYQRLTQPFDKEKQENTLYLTPNNRLMEMDKTHNNSFSTKSVGAEGSSDSGAYSNSIVPFPDVDPSWFKNGLPDKVQPEQKTLIGDLIDVVPINYIADVTKSYVFAPLIGNGYWIKDGKVIEGELSTSAKAGELIATAMYDVKASAIYFKDTKENSTGFWKLLQDFGGIDPGSTSSQTVTVTSGITETEGETTSYSIGFTAGIKGGFDGVSELSASLTTTLSQSFSTSVSINQQQSVSTTVDYKAQDRAQRIGLYQFYRSYGIVPGKILKEEIANKFYATETYKDIHFELATTISPYATNHFQKVFVLEP